MHVYSHKYSFYIHQASMFPIWDDKIPKTWVTPFVSYFLIVINVLVFFYQATLNPAWFEAFVMSFWTIPEVIMWWTQMHSLFTNMFLHWSRMHLIGNMLFLRVFGDNIEARMWNIKFLLFYICGWLAASAAHILLNTWSSIPAVGASGAIAAVLGAYLVMFPHSKIKMIYPTNFRVFYIWAVQFLAYWIVIQIVSGVGDWWNIWWWTARWAHIWWFAFWYAIGQFYGKQPGQWVKQKEYTYTYK